jgi:hypothetical protein
VLFVCVSVYLHQHFENVIQFWCMVASVLGVSGETYSVPRWVVLMPEPVPPVANIDMATGAERGFFGPTNPNNSVGATRSNFCMLVGDRISCPEFGPKKPPSEEPSGTLPVLGPAPRPDPVNEKGHPSKVKYLVIGDVA